MLFSSRFGFSATLVLALVACGGGVAPITDGAVDAPAPDAAVDAPAADAPLPADGGMDAIVTGDSGMDAGPVDGGSVPVCGDRRITTPEQCDDGNTTPGDGCDATCHVEPSVTCGNSIVDVAMGEQCDDGNTTPGDGCGATCLVEVGATCGDGTLDPAGREECDDGNTVPGDGCGATCQLERVGAFCGDGTIDPGEICDDSNLTNGDACNPTCNFTNTTSLFVGSPGAAGTTDGIGMAARLGAIGTGGACGAFGALASDNTYLYFGDAPNRRLRRIEVSTATVQTIAGDGTMRVLDMSPGTSASFGSLEAVTTDGHTIWVADSCRIRAVDATAPYAMTTVAGGPCAGSGAAIVDGVGAAATWADIRGVTYYGGLVYSVDASAAVLRSFDPTTGMVTTLAGTAGMSAFMDAVGTAARFVSPRYIASDNSGMLYIADTNGARVRAYNTVTRAVTTFAGDGTPGIVDGVGMAARIGRPRGMTSDGTSIYLAEFNAHLIRQGDLATQTVSTMIGMNGVAGYGEGIGTAATLSNPFAMTFHFPSRSLFVLDGGNCVIRRIR